jgi:hypothetical protein
MASTGLEADAEYDVCSGEDHLSIRRKLQLNFAHNNIRKHHQDIQIQIPTKKIVFTMEPTTQFLYLSISTTPHTAAGSFFRTTGANTFTGKQV